MQTGYIVSVILHVNPFTTKGSPFDEYNRLALDRVKSIKAVKGLIINKMLL